MDAKECAERLNTLAWNLDGLSEQLSGHWEPGEVAWKDGELFWDVTRHIDLLYADADLERCARRIEFDLDAGPSRRENFAELLNSLREEAHAIEYNNPRDVFRWLREDRNAAAADFGEKLESVAEYLWEYYWKLLGEDGSQDDYDGDNLPAQFRDHEASDGEPLVLPYLEVAPDWMLSKSQLTNARRAKVRSVDVKINGKTMKAHSFKDLLAFKHRHDVKQLNAENDGH